MSIFKKNMDMRCNVWRRKLLGNGVERKRELWARFVNTKKDTDIPRQVLGIINRDMPRTYPNIPEIKQHMPIIRKLLVCYAAVHCGDSYLQGFNYIMSNIYYVFKDTPHAEPDTWWCFVRLIGLIRPLMPDFNTAWFHWMRRHWQKDITARIRKKCPKLHSLLVNEMDSFSTLVTVKWFMIWFSQSLPFEDVFLLWDFLIDVHPSRLLHVYTQITFEILSEAAPTLTYNWSHGSTNLLHTLLQLRISGMEHIIETVRRRV